MNQVLKVKFLDLAYQYQLIKSEIDSSIKSTIVNSAFIGGEKIKEFETAFADYQECNNCISVANGTDALEIAIEALNFPKGSEIIVPANSFIASSEAVSRNGHKVVFADVAQDTYTLETKDLEKYITPKTTAIIAVHLYGHPCDMDNLLKLSKKYNLKIIEDCAQAHGAIYKGRKVGSIADIATFSFYPGKNLGAYGDGGAILTNQKEIAIKCKMIANHGRIEKYNHEFEGRNSRLDALQAGILLVKLNHLDSWLSKRRSLANKYIENLKNTSLILPFPKGDIQHSYHLFVIRSKYRNELKKFLEFHGIQVGIHYPIALPKLKAYKYLGNASDLEISKSIDSQVLSLPMGEHLSENEVDYVCNKIIDFEDNKY